MTAPFTPSPELIENGARPIARLIARAEARGKYKDLAMVLAETDRIADRMMPEAREYIAAAIAVIAPMLGEEAAKKIEHRFGKPRGERGLEGGYQTGLYDAAEDIAAALRADFGVPSAPTIPECRGRR